MSLRLNIGAGNSPIEGFRSIDASLGDDAARLDFADNSVEEIRASHILEHFSHRQTLDVLREWVRVLKPGGRIRLAVPDFDYIVRQYEEGTSEPLEAYLMGSHADGLDKHGAIFNADKLRELMRTAGLGRIRRWTSDNTDCAALPCSLNLEGVKLEVGTRQGKLSHVTAVMSLPRLSFTDNMFSILRHLAPLGMKIVKGSGVYWHQQLTTMIEEAIADGAKYILTIDYDTVFTADDVWLLHDLLEAGETDAAVPVQMRRGGKTALFTLCDDDGKFIGQINKDALEADLLPINSGHFGLTLLRAECFASLERPWFGAKPDADGRWGEKRIDADVAFWYRWREAGWRVHQANRVCIGHLQTVVTWPSAQLTPIHQLLHDYETSGRPNGVLC